MGLEPLNKGPSFFGEDSAYTDYSFYLYATQLCLLLVVQIFCFAFIMDKINGRVFQMRNYFQYLTFDLFGHEKPDGLVTYLLIVGYSFLIMPFVTIIVWAVTLFVEGHPKAGASVFLLGLAALLLVYGILKIKWNNWRFKNSHLWIILVQYLLVTTWQFIMAFRNNQNNFVVLSATFLTQNGLCATLVMFLNLKVAKFNLYNIIQKHLRTTGEDIDPSRDDDINEEVIKQHKDEKWFPNEADLTDLISIGRIS